MAVYDRDATASTAVTAFLAQFKVAANGNITYVSGTDTFHVWWLHRALQKIAWDFAISGDDEINLSKPNPSTSEALGTIITLLNHSTDYSVRYNITDTVAQYLFGGSVEQYNSSNQLQRYSGLQVLGSVNLGTTELQIVQDGGLITSHWGTGKNQTDSNTLLRILVKTWDAGAEIDNSTVVVKASEWYDTYAYWTTVLGLGEKVAAINTANDPQNTTLLATVQAYGITKSTGYGWELINVDGAGNKNFIGAWDHNSLGKKALAEYVKAIITRGTTDTFFGIDGDLWTGRVYDIALNVGTGGELWVEPETVTWSTGEGQLMAINNTADDTATRMILHLNKGLAPTNGTTLTGATNSASQTVNGTPTTLSTAANHLGLFTGSNWIGAYGIGFLASQLTYGDSVTSLDGETPTVPQNVTVTINVECDASDVPHVFFAEKDGVLNAPDYTVYTLAAQSSGSSTITINESIASDEPQDGWILVLPTGATTYKAYHYSSWTGSVFTLDATDHPTGTDEAFTLNDDAFVAVLYTTFNGAGTTKTATNTFIYSADRPLIGWVRHGDPAAPDKPVPISGTVTSAGLTLTVVLDNES